MQPGPKNLITDVEGIVVGNAEDQKIKTGVTVLSADKPLVTSYFVMGGAPPITKYEVTNGLSALRTVTPVLIF